MTLIALPLAAVTLTLAAAPAASASCIRETAAQQRARAHVIFTGVALDDPTASGIQRFRVTRWSKVAGPRIVRVATGNKRRADGSGSVTSVSIIVGKGERWRILGRRSPTGVVATTVCDGSRRI